MTDGRRSRALVMVTNQAGYLIDLNPGGYAADRRLSSLCNQTAIWFQLANVRLTILPKALSALSRNVPRVGRAS